MKTLLSRSAAIQLAIILIVLSFDWVKAVIPCQIETVISDDYQLNAEIKPTLSSGFQNAYRGAPDLEWLYEEHSESAIMMPTILVSSPNACDISTTYLMLILKKVTYSQDDGAT